MAGPTFQDVLLSSLSGGGGVDVARLLAPSDGAGDGEDRTAFIRQWLEQQQQQRAAAAPAEPPPSAAELELQAIEARQREARRRERRERAREVARVMKAMYAELELLRERNDVLAVALGACHLCFGRDPGCAECGGAGGPGASAPDPGAFRDYVVPAVRRVRAAVRPAAPAATGPPVPPRPNGSPYTPYAGGHARPARDAPAPPGTPFTPPNQEHLP